MSVFSTIAQIVNESELDVPRGLDSETQLETILSVVFAVAAAVAVLVIVIAGLSYVLSAGDPQKAAKAKNTILYAVIGLVVAIFAQVIVSFVVGRVL